MTFGLFSHIILRNFGRILGGTLKIRVGRFNVQLTHRGTIARHVRRIDFARAHTTVGRRQIVNATEIVHRLTDHHTHRLIEFAFGRIVGHIFSICIEAVNQFYQNQSIVPA